MQTKDSYQPVEFNPKAYAEKERKLNPDFANAYDALDDEFPPCKCCCKCVNKRV